MRGVTPAFCFAECATTDCQKGVVQRDVGHLRDRLQRWACDLVLATEIDAALPSVNAPGRRICGATQSASAEERQGLTGQEILA